MRLSHIKIEGIETDMSVMKSAIKVTLKPTWLAF